jgi:hypothetical protein
MELLSYSYANEPVVVAPIGDIQWLSNGENVAIEHLQKHLDYCLSIGAYFVGTGDYTDFMSPSNRQRLQGAALYDNPQQALDDMAISHTERLFDSVLKVTAGRWLCLLEGHHFAQLLNGYTTDQLLADKLGTVHAGSCVYIRLHFIDRDRSGDVLIWAHHGPNRNVSDPAAYLERNVLPYWDAHVFMMGHVPRLSARVHNRISPQYATEEGTQQHQEARLVGTGGWAKAYVERSVMGRTPRGDYAERGMMSPGIIGAPIITVEPYWNDGVFDPRVRVSL